MAGSISLFLATVLLAPTGVGSSAAEKLPSFSKRIAFDSLGRLRSTQNEDGSYLWTARDLAGRAHLQTYVNLLGSPQMPRIHGNDGWRRVASSGASGDKRFVFGRSLDELIVQESGGEQFVPVASQLGSTMKLLGGAGTISDQFRYDAFGAPLAGNAKTFSHLFAGAIYDHKSKLYDLRNRHYDPKVGRFLSRDPLGMHADGFNTGNAYAYVGNNPLNRRDPMGLLTGDETAPPAAPQRIFINNGGPFGFGAPEFAKDLDFVDIGGAAEESFDWVDAFTRVGGGLQAVGGGIETAVGMGVMYVAGWTGIGAWGGGAIAAHGLDQVQAGARTAWNGAATQSLTAQAVTAYNVRVAGLDRETAATLANALDASVSIASTLGVSSGTQAPRLALAFTGSGGKTLALAGAASLEAPAAVAAAHAGASLMTGVGSGEDGGEGPGDVKKCFDPDYDSGFGKEIGGWNIWDEYRKIKKEAVAALAEKLEATNTALKIIRIRIDIKRFHGTGLWEKLDQVEKFERKLGSIGLPQGPASAKGKLKELRASIKALQQEADDLFQQIHEILAGPK